MPEHIGQSDLLLLLALTTRKASRVLANQKIELIWFSVVEESGGTNDSKVEWLRLVSRVVHTHQALEREFLFVQLPAWQAGAQECHPHGT